MAFTPVPDVQATSSNYRKLTLEDWQHAFWRVYGPVSGDMPLHDMTLQIVADSTRLAEIVRKRAYDEAFAILPHLLAWLFSLSTRVAVSQDALGDYGVGNSLASIIWNKYPRICSTCGRDVCECWQKELEEKRDREKAASDAVARTLREAERIARVEQAKHDHKMPVVLDGWVEMLERVFGASNRRQSAAEKTFHFFEEVGEVEQEARKNDRLGRRRDVPTPNPTSWEDEVADVFSWLVAVFLHLRGFVRRANTFGEAYSKRTRQDFGPLQVPLLSDLVWAEFGDARLGLRCPRCGMPTCACERQPTRR